jgi:hypothetical protein
LKKVVVWHIIKQAKNIKMPDEQDILRGVPRFSNKGLSISRGQVRKEEEDDIEESEEDNNSNGTRPKKVNMASNPKKALKALHERK